MTRVYTALRDRLLVYDDGETGSTDPSTAVGPTTTEGATDDPVTSVRLEGHALECVAVSPDAPERVFVGTFENGLFRSTDGGESFESLETPTFESDAVMAVTVSPHDPDTVYAGTEPSRVYRSSDGGDTWVHLTGLTDLPSESEWYFPPRPHTHHVRWLAVDPFDPDRLYVGIEAGAFVIRDEEADSWRERPEGSRIDNHSLATHPEREGRVYTAAGDGYAVSDDSGETWSHPQADLEHRYCWSVCPHPEDPDRVLVSSASGASRAHTPSSADAYVYRKPGSDADWERLDGRGLPMGEGVVRAILEADREHETVYAVTNRGLFVSSDFGDFWDRVPVVWDDELETLTPRGMAVVP